MGFASGFQAGVAGQQLNLLREKAKRDQAAERARQVQEYFQSTAGALRTIPPEKRGEILRFSEQLATQFLNTDGDTLGFDSTMTKSMLAQLQATPFEAPQPLVTKPGDIGRNPNDPNEVIFQNPPAETDLTTDQQLRVDLANSGYTEDQVRAININRNRFAVTSDQFGNRVVFDRFTGQFPAPEGTVQRPTPEPSVTTPEGGFEAGTGMSGFWANITNTISDALGAGLAFPGAEKAAQSLRTLQNRTELFLTASVPGRESNQVRQRLRELTVTPNSIFQGDERARERLGQTRDFISGEIGRLTGLLENPSGLAAKELSESKVNLDQLKTLLQTYDQIIAGFPAGQGDPGLNDMSDDELKKQLGIE